jgi:hypothetical protein
MRYQPVFMKCFHHHDHRVNAFAAVPPNGKAESTGDVMSKLAEFGDTYDNDSDGLGRCNRHTNDKSNHESLVGRNGSIKPDGVSTMF